MEIERVARVIFNDLYENAPARDVDGSFRRKIEAEKAELERRAFEGMTAEQIDKALKRLGVKQWTR